MTTPVAGSARWLRERYEMPWVPVSVLLMFVAYVLLPLALGGPP
jgi:hypothetical protein